jgi:hypothetical protein
MSSIRTGARKFWRGSRVGAKLHGFCPAAVQPATCMESLYIDAHVEDDSTLDPLIVAEIVNAVTNQPQTFNSFACGYSFLNLRWYDINTQERIKFSLPPQHPRTNPKYDHILDLSPLCVDFDTPMQQFPLYHTIFR